MEKMSRGSQQSATVNHIPAGGSGQAEIPANGSAHLQARTGGFV